MAGTENPGDALTKYLSGPEMTKHLARMGLELEAGRAETAPHLTTAVLEEMQTGKEVMRRERKLILEPAATPVLPEPSISSNHSAYVQCAQCNAQQCRQATTCALCESAL